MTVVCVDCANFRLKGSPVAKSGFGLCKFGEEWEYHSALYAKECRQYVAATDSVVAPRKEYLDDRKLLGWV